MIRFDDDYTPLRSVDWRGSPTVAFESDDWGACEYAPTLALWQDAMRESPRPPSFKNGKLESPSDIQTLCKILERYTGSDGISPSFTTFFCLANPDFRRIEESGFKSYFDIPIDRGFPSAWDGTGLVDAWREAVKRRLFCPEFHTRLHHLGAGKWLHLLNGEDPASPETRKRFGRQIYHPDCHHPEYAQMGPLATQEWIGPALETFERLFARKPSAGVTSDATPLTEIVWAANGIRTFCLRNFSIPGGAPIVYHTKPWNNQDPRTPMGAWNPETDVIYLARNVFFEPGFDEAYSFEKTMNDIEAVWDRNEPAIVSTHRLNYVNWDDETRDRGLGELTKVLERLCGRGDVTFMTSREISDIYRQGRARPTFDGVTAILPGPASNADRISSPAET